MFYFILPFMRIKTPSFFLWLSSDHDYMTPILLLISSTGRSTFLPLFLPSNIKNDLIKVFWPFMKHDIFIKSYKRETEKRKTSLQRLNLNKANLKDVFDCTCLPTTTPLFFSFLFYLQAAYKLILPCRVGDEGPFCPQIAKKLSTAPSREASFPLK